MKFAPAAQFRRSRGGGRGPISGAYVDFFEECVALSPGTFSALSLPSLPSLPLFLLSLYINMLIDFVTLRDHRILAKFPEFQATKDNC